MDETLGQFVEQATGKSHLRVEKDFGDGFVRLRTSEAERRQAAQDIRSTEDIVLEMLRNSRDAHSAHIFVAFSREGMKRTVTVIDDGCGIPESMHALVFEPRVTSKLDSSHMDAWGIHGRGMALYSISVNAEQARVVRSQPGMGSSIFVQTDLMKLSEKADQSTFPFFFLTDNSSVSVRGPKNVLRTVCEFAIESRATCSVFIGSPAEIVSTMYSYGMATLSVIDRLFPKEGDSVPLVKCLAKAGDPSELAGTAKSLGLSISERTARRVLDGEISELNPILDSITVQSIEQSGKGERKRRARSAYGIKLSDEEKASLASAAKAGFLDIADNYYLEGDVEPNVRVGRDRITIAIPIVKRD